MPKGEKTYYRITISDLEAVKGISRYAIRRDISSGRLCLRSLEDVIRWVNEPRIRSNKGKPLTWLNPKT